MTGFEFFVIAYFSILSVVAIAVLLDYCEQEKKTFLVKPKKKKNHTVDALNERQELKKEKKYDCNRKQN